VSNDWLERWQEGRTGWHEVDGNGSLRKHWTVSGKRVLVPLCGKSKDLLWLESEGNEVVGVELSEIAVEAFFDENEIDFSRAAGAPGTWVAKDRRITIHCGDYFSFVEGPFDACYDRGALVALAPDLRRDYVAHTQSLLDAEAAMLIVSVEYDQSIAAGPPFSISREEILSFWPDLQRIEAYDDIANCPPKFKEAGLREMLEVVWCRP
jgi:thiopurine S-methyltransferase